MEKALFLFRRNEHQFGLIVSMQRLDTGIIFKGETI